MKKPIYCPKCHSRVIDASNDTESQIKILSKPKKTNSAPEWKPDYIIKCWKCRADVGLKYIDILKN